MLAAVVPVLALSAVAASPALADTSSRVAVPSPNSANLLTEGATTTTLDPTRQLALRVYLTPQPGLAAADRARG